VPPQVSNQITNAPYEYITKWHGGFIVGKLVFRWEIQRVGSFVVFPGKPLHYRRRKMLTL